MASSIFTKKYIFFLIVILSVSTFTTQAFLSKGFLKGNSDSIDEQIDRALGYSINGNHAQSVRLLTPLAEKGVDRAKLYLGVAYYHGNGVNRNTKKAQELFFELQKTHYEPGIVNTYLNLIGSIAQK